MVLIASLAGCQGTPLFGAQRDERLMQLAVAEAGQIPQPEQKLRNLLVLADLQLDRRYPSDAVESLSQARNVLVEADDSLDEHTRISGWVSLSELLLRASRKAAADRAIDQAVEELMQLEPPTRRLDYVRGIGRQIRALRGKQAAAELVARASDWVVDLEDQQARRQATEAMADDLFDYGDYEAGVAMLHTDSDIAWRTETLTNLARRSRKAKWGKSVDFYSVFGSGSGL
ncbi:MAG: hypothetical protein ACLFUJ_02435 [Phycisphaerae bacterium]